MDRSLPLPLDIKLMNRVTNALFVLFGFLLLSALAGWVARAPLFELKKIVVTGELTRSNALTLRANVAPQLSGSFFTLDLAQVRKVFEGVPWVRRAVVRREFPDQLRVDLQEHQPVALWGAEAESRLVNHLGEVFEANTAEVDADSLVRLMGPDAEATAVLAMYRALAPQFEDLDLHVEQFEMSGSGAWRAQLESGAVVELGGGSNEEVLARTRRFLKTLTQVTARHARKPDALESADLRHVDGYALKLQGVTTLAPDAKQK
ncbi:MAG: hypothetical protein RL459_629, partial [Pseudomonadota bacterium]|jgi:cell division protein FtsQ